jgi:hypothetical protein
MAGQKFSAQEDRPGGPKSVIIGEGLWRSKFLSHASLLGRSISLDHESYKVVGIVSSTFSAEKPFDVWLPLQADPDSTDPINNIRVTGRLKRWATVDLAAKAVAETKRFFVPKYPNAALMFDEAFTAIPLRDAVVGDVREPLLMLAGAVAFVLPIACANVASLLVARTSRRNSELALRGALGANRLRPIRELLSESIVITAVGGASGAILGVVAVRWLLQISPLDLPRLGADGAAITLDWRLLIFAFLISAGSGIVFGLGPAITRLARGPDFVGTGYFDPVGNGISPEPHPLGADRFAGGARFGPFDRSGSVHPNFRCAPKHRAWTEYGSCADDGDVAQRCTVRPHRRRLADCQKGAGTTGAGSGNRSGRNHIGSPDHTDIHDAIHCHPS